MTLDKYIEALQTIRQEHGNLTVVYSSSGQGPTELEHLPQVAEVRVKRPGEKYRHYKASWEPDAVDFKVVAL
jgi:hypothetical protein